MSPVKAYTFSNSALWNGGCHLKQHSMESYILLDIPCIFQSWRILKANTNIHGTIVLELLLHVSPTLRMHCILPPLHVTHPSSIPQYVNFFKHHNWDGKGKIWIIMGYNGFGRSYNALEKVSIDIMLELHLICIWLVELLML